MSAVTLEYKKDVAYVTFNRAKKYNSVSMEAIEELCAIQKEQSARRDVRVVVVRGSGGNFCSGLDLSLFANPANADILLRKVAPHDHNQAQHICLAWRLLPMPVIAVLEGVCFGAGQQIALGADYRICSEKAKVSVLEAKWKLIPDMGITITGTSIRPDHLLMATYTAEMMSAVQAKETGFVSSVVSDVDTELARVLAGFQGKSLQMLQSTKKLLWDKSNEWKETKEKEWSAYVAPPIASVQQEEALQRVLLSSKDFKIEFGKSAKL